MIQVTKPYLPSKEKYLSYINKVYDTCWLTNNGPLTQNLEERLKEYLNVKNLILVSNGSMALQVAYRALNLTGEVITTPFSFAATTNTLIWQNLSPVFVDIETDSLNISPELITQKITKKTSAIVPVHVFGNPCNIKQIEEIADKHNLKVIYDAAHAFGVKHEKESVLNHGDISTLSFHATKLFHTIEGGAIITNDDKLADKIRLLINFGLTSKNDIIEPGINAKMNEFEAAMGLCILDDMPLITSSRCEIWERYYQALKNKVSFQKIKTNTQINYAYAPIILDSNQQRDCLHNYLSNHEVYCRKYFSPSLDSLAYIKKQPECKNSRDIADRILCLPIYPSLTYRDQSKIINLILNFIDSP